MKTKMLVRTSQARCVDSPAEQERLLATGDWLIASPKPRSKLAAYMRNRRAERRAAGWLQLDLWLTPAEAEAVKAAKLPGESYEALLVRLVNELTG